MFRKLFVILIVLLMLPAFANAWTVNAKTSPLTGQGTISPAGNITVSGTTGTFQDFAVSAATGYQISRVTVDGSNTAPLSGTTYRVPYAAGKSYRYIVAYFAVKTVNITTQVIAGSGAVREDSFESLTNIPVGSNRQILVKPNPGSVIATLTAAGATSITDNPDGSKTVIYNNLQDNQTVTASFSLNQVVTVNAGNDAYTYGEGAEFAATLYGSATSNQGAITYAWSGSGLSFGSPDAAVTTVYGATAGTFTATLTVIYGGITKQDSATVTVLNRTEYLESLCTACHSNNTPQIVADYDASPHKAKNISCQDCHTDTPHTGVMPSCFACHNPPPAGHNPYTESNQCYTCHDPHKAAGGSCDSCHDCPPATASHLKHFSGTLAQAGYGDTRITKDFNANAASYIMSCGNCHPMDTAKHRNGSVEVELYNSGAPAGSLKARNPAAAAYVAGGTVFTDAKGHPYSNGICSNVYCHSYNTWTTNAPIPADDPDWQNKVVVTRIYRDVTWGGTPLTCSGCHGNPTQTDYATNDGGAGDSHAWIDDWGYGNLHTFNHGYQPVSCSFCHNDTVKQVNSYTRTDMDITTLGDVPISNFAMHVNGVNDVSFNKQNFFNYSATGKLVSMDLSTATYAPGTKTCSNVACHFTETTVKWGTPYRLFIDNCDRCHGYGSP